MTQLLASNGSLNEQLCLRCGLCCNGVIFADVRLSIRDEARLRQAHPQLAENVEPSKRADPGQTKTAIARTLKLPQPCVALEGCRCRVYESRPAYCRQFECLVLKNVKAGRLRASAALRLIRTAQKAAERVKELLHQLGDSDEQLPLSTRFRQMQSRAERKTLPKEMAEPYGQLTLAYHRLNALLSEAFYR